MIGGKLSVISSEKIVSGRDHEPVAAFFPSIDRNLILDLDRQLRNGRPLPGPPSEPKLLPAETANRELQSAPMPDPSRNMSRPNISSVVQAVEHAAQSMAAMSARIEQLENHIDELEANTRDMEMQLGEAEKALHQADSKLRAEDERATRAEGAAAHQTARAMDLERELSAVHADLARVTEAIAAALGLPEDDIQR